MLGIRRITASKFTADELESTINSVLSDYNIDTNDILALISDGAAINLKYAKNINKPVVICTVHAIHLAVTKVMR